MIIQYAKGCGGCSIDHKRESLKQSHAQPLDEASRALKYCLNSFLKSEVALDARHFVTSCRRAAFGELATRLRLDRVRTSGGRSVTRSDGANTLATQAKW